MKPCDHCDMTLLTLAEFESFSAGIIASYVREYGVFLATSESHSAAYTDELHEDQRWLDFIIFLLGTGRIEIVQVDRLLRSINEQVLRVVPDTSGHKH